MIAPHVMSDRELREAAEKILGFKVALIHHRVCDDDRRVHVCRRGSIKPIITGAGFTVDSARWDAFGALTASDGQESTP